MDSLFTHSMLEEADDIPYTEEPVWILGKKYNAIKELEKIRKEIRSKLWFTYRKGFIPIGGFGSSITSDKGWGCMLRCGQMVLGEALIRLHLGENWEWTLETRDENYLKILNNFEDRRAAPYSIHQIALTGASEGKEVCEWFGPNTIAQVLKKLVVYDDWGSITIHVAMDNVLVINDVLTQCRVEQGTAVDEDENDLSKVQNYWKPLLLLIPLRLGLIDINPNYINGLKTTFQFPQSLGAIGGKPNHALYFIGCVENEVIFLDPHTTQMAGSVHQKLDESEIEMDATYHCKYASRISIAGIDPSIALCFLCKEEKDFLSLCDMMQERLIKPEKKPLFELCTERNPHWNPNAVLNRINIFEETPKEVIDGADRQYDTSDEEFELLG